ncbi:amidohydrolase family protein [Pseudoruegeria sp. SHC-113]|nr:amidohydrolase family protein [Pseudoruegeria sp. SHC-113]
MADNWQLSMAAVIATMTASIVSAQDAAPQTLFTNVHVFDGVGEARIENASVLVEGNLIKTVSTAPIDAPDATVIDGGGRTLMPGLIDSHVHLYATSLVQSFAGLQAAKWDQVGATAAENARDYLYDGYTTVRDTGGMGSGLRELIDRGVVDGPRIYASGAAIGPTSGHGDWRNPEQRTYNMG